MAEIDFRLSLFGGSYPPLDIVYPSWTKLIDTTSTTILFGHHV